MHLLSLCASYFIAPSAVAHVCPVSLSRHSPLYRSHALKLMVCGVPFQATEYLEHISATNTAFYHLLCECHLFSTSNTFDWIINI